MRTEPDEMPSLSLPSLPSGWSYSSLESHLVDKGISYGVVQPGVDDPDGVPVLRVGNLRNGRIAADDPLRISPDIERLYERTRLQGGEVVLSLVGSVGEVAVVPELFAGWNVARAVAVLRLKKPAQANWMKFCLQAPLAQKYMRMWQNTTVQATLNLGDVKRLPIVVPPHHEQDAIALILLALDDKIESNQRICLKLDAIARTDVHAAQVRADDVLSLGDLVERVSETVKPTDLDNATVYVGLEHIPRGSLFLSEWGRVELLASAKARFESGDVLFGKLRPYFQKVSIAPCAGVCSTDVFVLRPKRTELGAFATVVCASDDVINYASAGAHGTRMPRVSWEYLSAWKVRVPTPETLHSLQERLDPMFQLGIRLSYESVTLAELRGALLPKLLSGELQVRDAENLVEQAV
jgi:type I restriction enzyme S subunit